MITLYDALPDETLAEKAIASTPNSQWFTGWRISLAKWPRHTADIAYVNITVP